MAPRPRALQAMPSKTAQEAQSQYLEQLRADGRRAPTVAQYERYLHLLLDWWGRLPCELTPQDLARFMASPEALMRPDGVPRHPRTVNAIRTCVRGFLRYLWEVGEAEEDAGRVLRSALVPRPRPRPMRSEEVAALLAAVRSVPGPAAVRDYALLLFLARTGSRLGAALALDAEDLDLAAGEAFLRECKGGAQQRVFLPQDAVDAFGALLGTRTTGPVFQAHGAARLTTRQARRRFKEWLDRAGLPGHYSPHSLRHSFATGIYRQTEDLGLVQAALGHRSITSTMVYAQVPEDRVRGAVARLAAS